jgi:hypothetical protein
MPCTAAARGPHHKTRRPRAPAPAPPSPPKQSVAVMLGGSAGWILPYSYQCNLMVHAAGGYRTKDFAKFGAPLHPWLLVGVILILGSGDKVGGEPVRAARRTAGARRKLQTPGGQTKPWPNGQDKASPHHRRPRALARGPRSGPLTARRPPARPSPPSPRSTSP